jgi:hypothetical protein
MVVCIIQTDERTDEGGVHGSSSYCMHGGVRRASGTDSRGASARGNAALHGAKR